MSTDSEKLCRDIFDLIIDHASDSSSDLKALSLVAKYWLPRSRKHLFRRFCISEAVVHCDEDEHAKQQLAMRQSLSDCLHNETILARIDGFIIDQSLRWVWSSPGQLHLYPYGNSKDCDGAIPYDLTTLPPTKIQFLSYEWMTRSPAEVDCDYSTVFVEIARSVGKELKQLYLQDAHSYVPRDRSQQGFNLFKSLAVFTPLLETLCLQKMSYLPIKLGANLDDPSSLNALRRVIRTPSKVYGSAARRKISLKRLYFQTCDSVPNKAMEILLFKNRFLTFDNLAHLALDSISIPLFVGRPLPLLNVQSLTIFDDFGDSEPDEWTYNKARLSLPSLKSLQLVLRHHQSILTLCRVILGPCRVAALGSGTREEYPGERRFVDLESRLEPEAIQSSIRLHIQLLPLMYSDLSSESEMASRIDITLHSYLYLVDISHFNHRVPVESITVGGDSCRVVVDHLPLTASTGRMTESEGDIWWQPALW